MRKITIFYNLRDKIAKKNINIRKSTVSSFLHHTKNIRGDTVKAREIIYSLKKTLHSEAFQEKHKIRVANFTRQSVLNFVILMSFILKGIKKSTQTEIFELCDLIELPDFSKQAFSKGRKKISPSAFIELNDQLVYEFYNNKKIKGKNRKKLNKWKDYLVFAVDGSTIQLSEHEETKNEFGCATNQTEREVPLGRSVHIFDTLNGVIIGAVLNPYKTDERDGLYQLIEKLLIIKNKCGHKMLILLDRHYPSYPLIYFLNCCGIDYVMRCKKNFSIEIERIIESGDTDTINNNLWQKLSPRQKRELKKLGLELNKLENIPIRVISIRLPDAVDDESEFLLTSLTNKKEFKYKYFAGLYFFRWKIEGNIKFLKISLEIENFSGITPHAIKQEFHANILTSNIRNLLANEAQEILDKNERLNQNFKHIINNNISLSALKIDLIKLLLNRDSDIDSFCNKIIKRMTKSSVSIIYDRKFPRDKRKTMRKYHNNNRRAA